MIQAMTAVLDFAPDHWTASVRLVAIALADRVNADAQCWPSIGDVSRRTGLSARHVQRALRQLEAEGVIVRHGQRKGSGGQPVSNLWTWTLLLARGVTPVSPGGVTPVSPPPRGGGVTPVSPKPSVVTTRGNRQA